MEFKKEALTLQCNPPMLKPKKVQKAISILNTNLVFTVFPIVSCEHPNVRLSVTVCFTSKSQKSAPAAAFFCLPGFIPCT